MPGTHILALLLLATNAFFHSVLSSTRKTFKVTEYLLLRANIAFTDILFTLCQQFQQAKRIAHLLITFRVLKNRSWIVLRN